MVTIRKIRLHNPTKSAVQRTRSKAPKRGAKKNPASLITLGFTNPHRESKPKMKRKKVTAKARKRNPVTRTVSSSKPATHRRRRNPGTVVVRRRRRNPSVSAKGTDLAKNISSALVGLVVTRQAPQAILGASNAGLMGYGASILT